MNNQQAKRIEEFSDAEFYAELERREGGVLC